MWDCIADEMNISQKGKTWERNLISFNSSTKQWHENQLNQSENWCIRTASVKREEREGGTVNLISKSTKTAQKDYKTRHDWVGKVIHGNCAKDLTMLINDKHRNQNWFYKMDPIKFSKI